MKIYLDIFFLVNLGMNFVILLSESFFQNRKIKLKRLLLTSVIGAIVACIYVVTGIHRAVFVLILCYAVVSSLLVRIAFGKTTPGALVRNVLFFYTIAFMLGGILVQIKEQFLFPFSGVVVLGGASLFLLAVRWLLPYWRRWQSEAGAYYQVRICYHDRTVVANALWDTGNHLQDPFTGEPVLLGEKKILSHLWNNKEEPVIRMIPFHAVGSDSGVLRIFQADYVEVKKKNKWTRVNHPWIAICDEYLSSDGEFELILHPGLLQEE